MVTTNVLDNWRTIQKYKKKKDKTFVGDIHASTAWTGGSPTDFATTYTTSLSPTITFIEGSTSNKTISSGTTTGTTSATTGTISGMSVTGGTGGYATSAVTTSGYVYTPIAHEDDLKEAEKRIEELEQQVSNLENLYGRMKKLIEELTQKVAENNTKLAADVDTLHRETYAMDTELKNLITKEQDDYWHTYSAIDTLTKILEGDK